MKMTLLMSVLILMTGCNRVVVHGKVRPLEGVTRTYQSAQEKTLEAARQTLSLLGYTIEEEGPSTLKTRWISTEATSHYTDYFDQKDYGTVGAYYRLEVSITQETGLSIVQVLAPVKSLVGHQKSSLRAEKRFLAKLGDLLRREDFEMTNVGVE